MKAESVEVTKGWYGTVTAKAFEDLISARVAMHQAESALREAREKMLEQLVHEGWTDCLKIDEAALSRRLRNR